MSETLTSLYDRTLNNCKYYEKEGKEIHLNNEIGVLRGIAYCMELAGYSPMTDDFLHFINIQNSITDKEVI